MKVAVVIPLHKNALSDNEVISLRQCCNLLVKYDIFLLYPDAIDVWDCLQKFSCLKPLAVPATWMNSLNAYNEMKCSLDFYNLFKDYDYLLTYEPDAYIFSDAWEKANTFDFDYIGAPWFKDWEKEWPLSVGNSGFSMRNIAKCRHVLLMKEKYYKQYRFLKRLGDLRILNLSVVFKLINRNWKFSVTNYFINRFFSKCPINEDIFWSGVVPQLFSFKVADVNNAIKFSFEKNPSVLFQINAGELPLGCHAWTKNLDFWQKYIQV